MKWQILILSLPSRKEFLKQLLAILEPQIAALGLRKFEDVDVRIVTDEGWSRKEPPMLLGDKREYMRKQANADYINFIDDDDLISPDYVRTIFPLLDGAVDYVGFLAQVYLNKRPYKVSHHSLKYSSWTEDTSGYYRDISHLNPMRRELALLEPMISWDRGEDFDWAAKMRARAVVKTQHFVERPLYYYLWRDKRDDLKDPFDEWRLELMEKIASGQLSGYRAPQQPRCPHCKSSAIVQRGPLTLCNQCGRHWRGNVFAGALR